jgi:hypothetical protein
MYEHLYIFTNLRHKVIFGHSSCSPSKWHQCVLLLVVLRATTLFLSAGICTKTTWLYQPSSFSYWYNLSSWMHGSHHLPSLVISKISGCLLDLPWSLHFIFPEHAWCFSHLLDQFSLKTPPPGMTMHLFNISNALPPALLSEGWIQDVHRFESSEHSQIWVMTYSLCHLVVCIMVGDVLLILWLCWLFILLIHIWLCLWLYYCYSCFSCMLSSWYKFNLFIKYIWLKLESKNLSLVAVW